MPPKRKRTDASGASSSRSSSWRKKQPPPPPSPQPPPSPPRRRPDVINVDPETWDIRDPELDFFHPEEEYKDHPGRFSVAFHHGGSLFEMNEQKKYVGGRLTFFDFCNINQFELLDLSSMVLRLKYDRKTVCEFYYVHPKYSEECMGVDIQGPLLPITDDPHLAAFLEVAATSTRLVHIYVVELTAAAALLKKRKEEAEEFLKFVAASKKSKVVIQEVDEPEPVVPKPKPKKKRQHQEEQRKTVSPLLMIEWYPRDVEFEEYLTNSLEEKRREWKKEEEAARKNLMEAFASCSSAEGAPPEAVVVEVEQTDAVLGVVGQEDVHACVQEDVTITSMPTGPTLSTPLRHSVSDVQLEVEAVEDAQECMAEVTTQL